jgi:hypothetical protein
LKGVNLLEEVLFFMDADSEGKKENMSGLLKKSIRY